jgi:hypothetical protein
LTLELGEKAMTRSKRTGKSKRATGRLRFPGTLAVGGSITAAVAVVVFLIVYAATGDGGADEADRQIVETRAEDQAGEPFSGGPRLHFPVESVDLGQIPFNEHVQYAFAAENAGDAAVHIEDVQVRMLEGC